MPRPKRRSLLEDAPTSGDISRGDRRRSLLEAGTSGSESKGSTNPVVAVLAALDTGRRGVAAVLKELDDLVPGTAADRAKSDGFSLGDIPANYRQNIGSGDLVSTDNRWLDRALGLAGDIATDPLSYVTFGAAPLAKGAAAAPLAKGAASVSKQEVARAIARQAAETGDEALMDVAAKVARRGTGSLTAEEAARVGIKQGAQFGIGNAKVTLPGTGGLARGAEAATAGVRESVYGGRLGSRIQDVLNALDPQNKLSRTGLPRAEAFSAEGPLKKLVLVDQARLAKGEARAMATAARRELDNAVSEFKSKGLDLDGDDVRRALQGEAPASSLC